ncbi:hypothetical protein RhiirA5_397673 [Rhizophagus irregularis]|uniref:Uncharacterized protein n=3 Tax=Rhizophagus irregularis TaxID=588596 RepID=U9UV42_RHIID|nr:hypothetical protein GLOIN_2v1482468 [Rhizophagus irregularis DAOM 181602=DAOM 197198]EXX52507.1 hypothetical protein RirG_252480 [Rhizophagus irregularis DAOM 197198w]PKC11183.1 hypothetical protein RhiirA5_397673 [Rhizophagus irregularis]PKC75912.1 hypothetical protein RhiirA1_491139 [Rhizophagus irregularis]POG66250.1 hypothetical protein GLOIN_2v1482468 [Rhizophagus irregularis DAOM 181602=DAOM 197198]UZO24605.1 hypothetical protein OCT59_016901 [Rhizophagus irregularis]|eukprot:XP_025173116.1 hypothetical protein GLOIN_2v1482468 [Rhizophagus irregularis DAOM 181602=DAOM 197198]
MFSENIEPPNNVEPPNNIELPNNVEPPNDDVFYVKDELKLILKYFKNCNAMSSVVPDVDEQINKIREQGKEFHTCLQKSITQSNKFENHANNALDYLEILNDPNFDENHVSDILQILIDNAENNKNETREIKEKYESIRNKLQEIYTENFERRNCDRRELQSLIERRNKLEDNFKGQKPYTKGFFIIGFISFALLLGLDFDRSESSILLKNTLGLGIVTMGILTASSYLYTKKLKNNFQKSEREVNKLQRLVDLRNEISELREINNNLTPIIMQMCTFSNYWDLQHNILEDLNNNLENITNITTNNQAIKRIIVKPMKPRWENAKEKCDNYIRTVRKTITDVNSA